MGQYWNLQEIGFMIFTIVLRQNLGFYRLTTKASSPTTSYFDTATCLWVSG